MFEGPWARSACRGSRSRRSGASADSEGILRKTKIEIAVNDALVDAVIEAIIKSAKTGKVGDGKIFVFDLTQVVRIRTGERDSSAI
jgi:nitrogen regulatory protein PII